MSLNNGDGRKKSRNSSSVTVLRVELDSFKDAVKERHAGQDKLNDMLVTTQSLINERLIVAETIQEQQSETINELKKSNSLSSKILYGVIATCASSIAALLVMLIKAVTTP